MSKIHRSRPAISAFAAVLMLAVSDSIAVHGREEDLLRAPVPAASWDERSGYGAVEAIRATIGRPAASTTDQAYRVLAAADASGDEAPAPTAAEPSCSTPNTASCELRRSIAAASTRRKCECLKYFVMQSVENAPAIVAVHNHPSGDPTPSAADVALTVEIVAAGQLLDIELLDHLIIGQGRWFSLKRLGLGFPKA